MNKRFFLVILFTVAVSFGFSCRSKTIVKKLVNQNANIANKSETKKIDGVMYHLPKTIVQVTVPVKKATATPGDFAKFAPCFFSDSERVGMVTAPKQSFSIDPPSFSSRGVPDTSATYVISTKGKYFESKTLFVEYAPGYVLQKGEAESKNETLEFTVKAIATAAGVAAKLAPLAIGTTDAESKKILEELRAEYNCFNTLGIAASKNEVESEMKAIVKNKVIEEMKKDPKLKTPQVVLDPSDIAISAKVNSYNTQNADRTKYQKALLIFNNLKTLEEQRDKILADRGNNIPIETYKLMLEKNAEAIAAHRAAFWGLKSKEVWAATFEYAPDTDDAYSEMFFTYSPDNGVCNDGFIKKRSIRIGLGFEYSKDNLAAPATPYKCDNTPETNIKTLWLNVKKSDNQSFLQDIKDATDEAAKQDKSRGWFYRVPADGTIFLLRAEIPCEALGGGQYNCSPQAVRVQTIPGAAGNKIPTIIEIIKGSGLLDTGLAIKGSQIAFGEMPIAQLGVVASVPASTAGRSSVTTIMLDPTTGAMKNYKSSSSALVDKSILDDAGKAANSAIDAVDPLNKKKRELEELKTQNQINEQKKILSNTNTASDNDNQRR